jgi:HK97 family phage portal protein
MRRFWRWLAVRAAKYAGVPLRDPALVRMFGAQVSASGVDVTEDSALSCSAWYAGIRLLAQSIGSLPVAPYKIGGDGYTPADKHPSFEVLFIEPNYEMTPMLFHETLTGHAVSWGNGYARIEREKQSDPLSPVIALWPMLPNQVTPERDDTGEIFYRFQAHFDGEVDEDIPACDVIHVPGFSFDGLKGYSAVQRAREAIGLSIATETCGASLFGRGLITSGILSHPGELGTEAQQNLRESMEQGHRGPENTHRMMILEEGMTFTPYSMPPEQAQFIQTRQFQVVEIARWLDVPPHMLRDLTQATYSNIEHQGIDFLTYSLRPWLVKWQQEYLRKLFTPEERRAYYVGHDTTAFLTTDTIARYTAYGLGRNNGHLSLNDIMRKERKPLLPPEIGDTHLSPQNMQILEKPSAQPVEPALLAETFAFLKDQAPVPHTFAVEVLKAAFPAQSDAFIMPLVAKLRADGTVAGEMP